MLMEAQHKVLAGRNVKIDKTKAPNDEVPELYLTSGPDRPKFLDRDIRKMREKSFWTVECMPDAPDEEIKPPRKGFYCPITNTPLRLKELIDLNPEILLEDGESTEFQKWVCPICKKLLSYQKTGAVKFTGQIITMDCLEKFVFGKNDYYEGKTVTKNDCVEIVPGGTGFSTHNELEARHWRPSLK